jgi:predicted transcriptional regulator of viral defense system
LPHWQKLGYVLQVQKKNWLEDLKVQVADLAKTIMEGIKDPKWCHGWDAGIKGILITPMQKEIMKAIHEAVARSVLTWGESVHVLLAVDKEFNTKVG